MERMVFALFPSNGMQWIGGDEDGIELCRQCDKCLSGYHYLLLFNLYRQKFAGAYVQCVSVE